MAWRCWESKTGNTVGHVSGQVVKYKDGNCWYLDRHIKNVQTGASPRYIHSTGPEENQE